MELTIENLIKIIIGVLVFIVVVLGIYFFFKDYVIDFFKNLGGDETAKIILIFLK
ncbi:MAG: hypothetical protein ABIH65_02175 [Nanoarchaeota archaeon]